MDNKRHILHVTQGETDLLFGLTNILVVAVGEALRLGAAKIRIEKADDEGGVCVFELPNGMTVAQAIPDTIYEDIYRLREDLLTQTARHPSLAGFETNCDNNVLRVTSPSRTTTLLLVFE